METVFPGEEGLGDAASVRFDGLLQEHSLKHHRLHRSMGRCVRMCGKELFRAVVRVSSGFSRNQCDSTIDSSSEERGPV